MGRHKRVYAIVLALALTGAAGAQQAFKEGWMLEEHEASGINDLFLYWYDPETDAALVSISCQEGWPDVVVTAYMDEPEGPAPAELALADGPTQHAMEAISGTVGGRHSVGGITSFTPDLIELLTGQFTVLVNGIEIGRYSAKGAAESFERMIGACPVG